MILTSVHLPLASPLCWSWCGSRHRSNSLGLVWGQRTPPLQNPHTLCEGWTEQPTDGPPCWCLHKAQPGTPTESQTQHYKLVGHSSTDLKYPECGTTEKINRVTPELAWLQHWFHRSEPQHTDRLCSVPPLCLVHKPYLLPRHSNRALIRWKELNFNIQLAI